jgi:hypothetical protein
VIRVSIRRPRADGLGSGLPGRPGRGGDRGTQQRYENADFGEVAARVGPCPHCGMVHEYDCQKYVLINIVAALCIAASLLILIALLLGVVR